MKFVALLAAAIVMAVTADSTQITAPTADMPVTMSMSEKPAMAVTASRMAGDSLRVVVAWEHPTDGGGLEDSTLFRIKASNTIRLSGGGTVTPDTWRRRRWSNKTTADTFRVLMPPLGDSILWKADSISQCRKGDCSVPGGAGWAYLRSAAPPSMTFIRVVTDTF